MHGLGLYSLEDGVMFKRSSIIKPTIDDIAKYASFNPRPDMIGMASQGPVVVDSKSGLVGVMRPLLKRFRSFSGHDLYGVEFAMADAVPYSELEGKMPGRWESFKMRYPLAAKAVRYGALGVSVLLAASTLSCCGGSSGGSGGGNPGPTIDTTPPAAVSDLVIIPSANKPERVSLEFTSTGDDGLDGDPEGFLFRYAFDNPILTEDDWNNATFLSDSLATKGGGAFYSIPFDVPPGRICVAMKVYDEVGNESELSNSVCADVISKAEYYVDFWLPIGSIFLNYDEAVAMIQGEGDIPSYVSPIAAELVLCSNPSWPGTQAELEDFLLRYTNGVNNPGAGDGELHIANDPWYLDNDGVGANDPSQVLYFEPDGSSYNEFNNISYDRVRDIIREFLIQYVDAHREDYGNLCTDDPSCNPTWGTWD